MTLAPLCLLLCLAPKAGPIPFGDRIPPVSLLDLGRFPSLGACEERIDWLNRHLEWIELAAQLHPEEVNSWREYELEVRRRRECWRALRWAQSPETGWRLDSLRELRDHLGLFDYYDGHMPWW